MIPGLRVVLLCASFFLSSCAFIGLKSLPWSPSVDLHDSEAIGFFEDVPRSGPNLGTGLTVKSIGADDRAIGLAVSGGGMRAAAFTLGVLAELQTLCADQSNAPGCADHSPNMLDAIDFISANSGGAWGVSAYLADRADRDLANYNLQEHQSDLIGRFASSAENRVTCWAEQFNEDVTRGATYQRVYAADNPVPLPAAFINSTLLPSQSPFVFSDAFVDHYRVISFEACHSSRHQRFATQGGIADVPIGYAAATSGSVPGFYYSYARTGLCDAQYFGSASFCHSQMRGGPRNSLHLVDGGIYDNIGFSTLFEIFYSIANSENDQPHSVSHRAALIIDSNFERRIHSMSDDDADSMSFMNLITSMGLPSQDARFQRLYLPMLASAGVENVVLLNFFSTANFPTDDPNEQHRLLHGLEALAEFAAFGVDCFDSDGRELDAERQVRQATAGFTIERALGELKSRGGDCLSENFYRVGTLIETSYKADYFEFLALWQLGQLSVRMNRDRILSAFVG